MVSQISSSLTCYWSIEFSIGQFQLVLGYSCGMLVFLILIFPLLHCSSSKCQIIHWRQGHKYECHPQGPSSFERDDLNEDAETAKPYETNDTRFAEDLPRMEEKNINGQLDDDVLGSPVPRLSTVTISSSDIETGRGSSGENETPIMGQSEDKNNSMDNNTSVKKLNREKSRKNDRGRSRSSTSDISPGFRKDNSSDRALGNIPSSKANEVLFVSDEGQTIKPRKVKSLANKHSGNSLMASRSSSVSSELPHNGFTSSLQKVAQHIKSSQQKKPPQNSLLGMSANRNCKVFISESLLTFIFLLPNIFFFEVL